MPKASAPEFHQKHCVRPGKPSSRPGRSPGFIESLGGLAPTASGANSVASALGNLAGRDPGEAVRTYHEGPEATLQIGTFYLAGNRNFLFGSDRQRSVRPVRQCSFKWQNARLERLPFYWSRSPLTGLPSTIDERCQDACPRSISTSRCRSIRDGLWSEESARRDTDSPTLLLRDGARNDRSPSGPRALCYQ